MFGIHLGSETISLKTEHVCLRLARYRAARMGCGGVGCEGVGCGVCLVPEALAAANKHGPVQRRPA